MAAPHVVFNDATARVGIRPRGRGTAAALDIAMSWFTACDNIAHRDFGPPITNVEGSEWYDSRVSNLRWFQENQAHLAEFAGRWVAVLNGVIEADGTSFAIVHDDLSARSINGALIVRVSDDVKNRSRLIA